MGRVVFFLVRVVLGMAFLGALGLAGLLYYPDPLFRYHVESGRLSLLSDEPFDAERGRDILNAVDVRLRASTLDDGVTRHAIVIANTEWRRRLVFILNGRAAGLNYAPLTHAVFLRHADVSTNRLYRANGQQAPPPRTLVYYAAHEIGHTMAKSYLGFFAHARAPRWIVEGVADYIGFAGRVDVEDLKRAVTAHDPTLDPRSGYYARYRLLVADLIQNHGWTVERILRSNMPQAEAERIVFGGT